MNSINLDRKICDLPPEIKRDLMIARMVTLEGHLGAVNPHLELNLYVSLCDELAEVYRGINRFPTDGQVVVESDL